MVSLIVAPESLLRTLTKTALDVQTMQTWCNSGADCLLWIDFAGDPPEDQEKPLQICLGQFIILSLEVLTCHASQDVSLRHWHAEFQVTVSTSFYIYISYFSLSLSLSLKGPFPSNSGGTAVGSLALQPAASESAPQPQPFPLDFGHFGVPNHASISRLSRSCQRMSTYVNVCQSTHVTWPARFPRHSAFG